MSGIKSTNNNDVTKEQIKKISVLLNQRGLTHLKDDLIMSFTDGRTNSRSLMYKNEAAELIQYLESNGDKAKAEKANTMRRKILAMAHNLQWENADGSINMHRVNQWCLNYSVGKKVLDAFSYEELPKLVSQFQMMYKNIVLSK